MKCQAMSEGSCSKREQVRPQATTGQLQPSFEEAAPTYLFCLVYELLGVVLSKVTHSVVVQGEDVAAWFAFRNGNESGQLLERQYECSHGPESRRCKRKRGWDVPMPLGPVQLPLVELQPLEVRSKCQSRLSKVLLHVARLLL